MTAAAPPPVELLCKNCRGSGVCIRCDAKGHVRVAGQRVKCLVCSGTTVCPECRGSGWLRAPARRQPG